MNKELDKQSDPLWFPSLVKFHIFWSNNKLLQSYMNQNSSFHWLKLLIQANLREAVNLFENLSFAGAMLNFVPCIQSTDLLLRSLLSVRNIWFACMTHKLWYQFIMLETLCKLETGLQSFNMQEEYMWLGIDDSTKRGGFSFRPSRLLLTFMGLGNEI